MAWVFIEILIALSPKAKKVTETIKNSNCEEIPIPRRAAEKRKNPKNKRYRLSNLETNQAEIGKPTSELIGKIKRKLPNSASFIWNEDLIDGIRDAQVEKLKPHKKKKIPSAIRW